MSPSPLTPSPACNSGSWALGTYRRHLYLNLNMHRLGPRSPIVIHYLNVLLEVSLRLTISGVQNETIYCGTSQDYQSAISLEGFRW